MTLSVGAIKSSALGFSGALTNAYQFTTPANADFCNQILAYVNVTNFAALATVEVKAQGSYDGDPNTANWFDIPIKNAPTTAGNEDISVIKADVAQIPAGDAPKVIAWQCMYKQVRAAIKGTGTAAGSTATVTLAVGVC